jgi:hypothetical protein
MAKRLPCGQAPAIVCLKNAAFAGSNASAKDFSRPLEHKCLRHVDGRYVEGLSPFHHGKIDMASTASDGLHRWTDGFFRLGEQYRAAFETFARGATEQNLSFLRHSVEQRRQAAERLRNKGTEMLDIQQDFAKRAFGDWAEHAHKLSNLYWDATEKRMEQTTQTIASVVPFARGAETPAGEKRKAA